MMLRLLSHVHSAALILAFAGIGACSSYDPTLYGRVKPYSSSQSNAFIFSVNEEFLRANQNSKKDEGFPVMSEAEAGLLKQLLVRGGYCLNNDGKAMFAITSKQEKIYDVTFAHLIEQNYNAKPVAPRMYFGQCL